CISNRNQIQFSSSSLKSSLIISAGTLATNETYQFMVRMTNRDNSSVQTFGYLLVQVDRINSPMIVISCAISTMCVPNLEFQLLNPTTQIELFSLCIGDCTSIENITWNIYYGYKNGSLNSIEWFQLNHNSLSFGSNTTNLN
ncbi:unnamed protein product, partial [Adineta ricciae]